MPRDLLAEAGPRDLLAGIKPPAPEDPGVLGRIGDWLVDNTLGGVSEQMRDNARTGDFRRDAAKDEGFFDWAGSVLERGGAAVDKGIYDFLGGLGSRRAREEAANITQGTVAQPIAGKTEWEDVEGTRGLGKFVGGAALESLPAMGALAVPFAGPAIIAASQTGNIAADRAANNGTGDITPDDLKAAAPWALGSTALDLLGLKFITKPLAGNAASRVVGATLGEGLTETTQSGLEYAGGTVGTQAGFDPRDAFDQMIQGGLVGAAMGGGGRAGAEIASPITARLSKAKTQRAQPGQGEQQPDATDWEGSLDDLLAPDQGAPRDLLALPPPSAANRPAQAARPDPVDDGVTVAKAIFGDKARITSGYRGPDHPLSKKNPTSWHAKSRAAVDMAPIPGMTFDQAKAAIEAQGYTLIEAIDERGKGKSRHATGDHWHFVIGRGGAPVGGTATAGADGDVPAVDIPGADGELLGRGDSQPRIAKIDIPEASPEQREAGKATPVEIDLDRSESDEIDAGAGQSWSTGTLMLPGARSPDGTVFPTTYMATKLVSLRGEQTEIKVLVNGEWVSVDPSSAREIGDKFSSESEALAAAENAAQAALRARREMLSKREAVPVETPEQFAARIQREKAERANGDGRGAPHSPVVTLAPLPDAPAQRVGPASQVTAPRIGPVDTQFEIRDLSELTDSANPNYDKTLQPRDRAGRATSGAQIASIAANLDPAQLADSRLASTGAPIIGSDGQVESGNGRISALAQVYAQHPERAAAYRQMIEGMGLDVNGVERPVLVRRRTTDMTPEQRRAWTRAANERDTMAMSSTEQASADAAALDDSVLALYRGGAVTAAANRDFVRAFIGKAVAPAEQNAMTAADGSLSADGVRRIRFALLAHAYGDTELIARISEDTDTNIAAIGKALLEAAPAFVRLKARIAAGDVPAQYDISQDIAEAARMVSRSRDSGQSLKGMLAQADAFSKGATPATEAVLRLFFRDAELTKPRSGQKVADALIDYTNRAEAAGDSEKQGADIFGNAPSLPSPAELLDQARAALDGDAATQGDLLTAPAKPATVAPDVERDRPDTGPASGRGTDTDAADLPRARLSARGGQLRALGIAQELRTGKSAALIGRTAGTPKELAEIAQVYRDPRYETFRIFYTKGNEIVHATGVSSRATTEADILPEGMNYDGFIQDIKDTMRESGADGYYLLHNHPSGDPDPSPADKTVTRQIAARVPGFRAHVVINSNKYAAIVVNSAGRTRSSVSRLDMGEDKLLKPSVPHNALGSVVSNAANFAALAKGLQKPGYVTVIGVDAHLRLRVILDYPADIVKRDAKALMAMARRIQRQSGSGRLFLVGDSAALRSPVVARAASAGIIVAGIDDQGNTIVGNSRGKGLPTPRAMRVAQSTPRTTRVEQSVYHGTPHDWEGGRADLSKIGTGEGAQAYGWGLYFASKREIAEHYRNRLSGGNQQTVTPKGSAPFDVGMHGFLGRLIREAIKERVPLDKTDFVSGEETYSAYAEDMSQAIARGLFHPEATLGAEAYARRATKEYIDRAYDDERASVERMAEAAYAYVRDELTVNEPKKGRLYTVDIPEDGEYLLWDATFDEQPDAVKAALRKLGETDQRRGGWTVERNSGGTWTVRNVWGEASGVFLTEKSAREKADRMTAEHRQQAGARIYRELANQSSPREASQKLRAAGIAGIKYLDGSSRSNGEGSFNYVLFDDSRIETLAVEDKGAAFDASDAAFKRWAGVPRSKVISTADALTHEFKTGAPIAVEAYHGTARPDRVGGQFRADRATAGPMAYFTSDPELASSYAIGKDDTSIDADDFNYENWFKLRKGDGEAVSLTKIWYSLPATDRVRIRKLAPRVQTDHETGETIELGPESNTRGNGGYHLRGRMNPLEALVEAWLTSGALFDQESRFIEVLKLAGVPTKDIIFEDPHAKASSVYPVFISMRKPLVSKDIPGEVVDALKAAAEKNPEPSTGRYRLGWDKNDVSLADWVEDFLSAEMGEYAWTRIPDAVTDVFRSLGYDGIVDWSGKGIAPNGSSERAPVYIPFADSQVKSQFNRGTFDRSDPHILREDTGQFDPGPDLSDKLVDKDGISRDIAAIKKLVGNPLETLGKVVNSGLADNARALFYTMDSRLRTLAKRYDSEAINFLADQFHARAGVVDKATGETYHEAVDREGFGRAGKVWRILEPFAGNKGAMDRIGLMLRNPGQRTSARKAEAQAAAKIARLLKDTIDYRKAAGEDIGEVTDGYFPRMIDVEKAVKQRGLFLRQATELYRLHGAADPKASAEAWLARLFDQYAGLDGGPDFIDLFHDTRKAGVGRSTSKGREFGKDADKLLAEFYDNDTGQVLTAYMIGAARKAEEARRFGGDKLKILMNRIKKDIRKSGEDAGDTIDTIARMVATNLGRTAMMGERTRATTSVLHTAGQLGTLDRATITSLSEAMMGFVRAGPKYGIPMLVNSWREFARQVRKAPPSEAARLSEALGIATDALVGEALAARAGFERANTTKRAQKVQMGFFRATGLHQWTEGTRTAATRMGQHFLRDLAIDMAGRNKTRAAEYLRELGVKDPEGFARWLRDGGTPGIEALTAADADPMARQYRTALVRFANQTIMKPTRAQKPRWASHPVGSLFFALMSFSYGFKKNVLDRTGRMGMRAFKEKDPTLLYPAFGLAGLFAMHTAIQAGRQALLGGGREDDEEGFDLTDLLEAMDRAGLFGAASPLLNAVFGLKYRRGVIESMAGPVIGRPADLVTKTVSLATDANSPNTNNAERAAAAALYDIVLEPALEAYGVTRFKGPVAAAAVWGSGNREGGVAPPDRDWFVEAVAGPKEE